MRRPFARGLNSTLQHGLEVKAPTRLGPVGAFFVPKSGSGAKMARLFDSYVMVDWSAASKPSTGKDSIWIGVLAPDARLRLTFRASNPSTRIAAVDELSQLLSRLTNRGDRVLLGFDFPLGFPKGTAASLKLKNADAPWRAIRDFLSKEMKDKPDNSNNRFALAARMNRLISDGPFPFWGCAKRDALTTLSVKKAREHGEKDLPEYRLTELAAAKAKLGRPQPIWKIAYAGAVGGQALTGIPAIEKLQEKIEGLRLWPFEVELEPLDQEAFSETKIIAVEIYPSMIDAPAQASEIKDEAQVRIIAEHYANLDEAGRLGPLFAGSQSLSEDEKAVISSEEGWILGV